jgi:hypothetical protein
VPAQVLAAHRGVVQHHVADQHRALQAAHRGLAHRGVRAQGRLHLADLDPESADLHLAVGSPAELQQAVLA